ncbi:MAG: endonuclease domain-containing protein [Brevundimonas sp.]|nr:endonuclease domain-containing protein [Brevundimonas sp.]MBX9460573.1 endonuclease domain-containing protein [Brevundimonas sp.]
MPDGLSYTRAKGFRRRMTPPEARLWRFVRAHRLRGYGFRRQFPIGPFILDFYCAAARLAVEIDGAVHDDPERMERDRRRTAWLGQQGVRVIRLRATAVRDEIEGVLEFIVAVVRERRAEG